MNPILESIGAAAVRISQLEAALAERDAEIERVRSEYQAVLIWAKLVYRWLSTYFAVPPKFMRDVPPAIIRER